MYKCNSCGRFFDEPNYKTTTYGEYYGAEDPYRQTLLLALCPHCGEEDDMEECGENEQYVDDLWKDIKVLKATRTFGSSFKMSDDYFDDIVYDFRNGLYDYDDALIACDQLIKEVMLEEDRKASWDSLSKQLSQVKENTK